MSRIPIIEWEDASSEVREIYEDINRTRKEGVSKSYMAYASNIHVLKANWEKNKRLSYGETYLPFRLKQSIEMAVSKAMGCEA